MEEKGNWTAWNWNAEAIMNTNTSVCEHVHTYTQLFFAALTCNVLALEIHYLQL